MLLGHGQRDISESPNYDFAALGKARDRVEEVSKILKASVEIENPFLA